MRKVSRRAGQADLVDALTSVGAIVYFRCGVVVESEVSLPE